jgi:hypothetical protein
MTAFIDIITDEYEDILTDEEIAYYEEGEEDD